MLHDQYFIIIYNYNYYFASEDKVLSIILNHRLYNHFTYFCHSVKLQYPSLVSTR